MQTVKKIIFSLLALALFNPAFALETHTKLWLSTIFTGSLSPDKKLTFYFEPDQRFIDDKYKYHQTLVWMGLGYQLTPRFAVFVGDTPTSELTSQGTYQHSHIVWQQLNWLISDTGSARYDSRSRLEEVKRIHDGSWGVVLRERLQLRYPLQSWERHALVMSEEVFLDLETPRWSNSNNFFAQNRAFAGINTQLSSQTAFTVGYLNQYQFTQPNQMSHVIICSLEVNMA